MDVSVSLTGTLLCVLGYLSGSWLGAVLVTQALGKPDPRRQGSGNPGATNVYRVAGTLAAVLTLIFDAAKGMAAVGLAKWLGLSPLEQGLVALFALLGHMLPAFHGFRGGKGVATALGCGLVMAWETTSALTLIWLLVLWRFRVSSVASITAALLGPLLSLLLNPGYLPVFLMIMVVILIRHANNLRRLWRGEEQRLRPPPP